MVEISMASLESMSEAMFSMVCINSTWVMVSVHLVVLFLTGSDGSNNCCGKRSPHLSGR